MFSYAQSVAQPARHCSEATFKQIIADPKVAEICMRVQALKEAGDKDAANAAKKLLPVFTYQATFLFGKRSIKNAQPNGLVMCDFDGLEAPLHLPPIGGVSPTSTEFCKAHGIVLMHLTPSGHGLRVVFKGDTGKNYVENQHDLAVKLGLPLDEACKDLARCSFAVPEDHILYLDPELFTYNNPLTPQAPQRGKEALPHSGESEGTSGESEEASALFKGIPYSTIIAEWWKQTEGEPQMGERNTKLHRLAANLRYICDNDEALLLRVMPTYGLPETEMRSLIHSACDTRLMWSMPKKLAEVLKAVGVADAAPRSESQGAGIFADEMMTREENAYWLQRLSEISLPRGLKESLDSVADENKMNALVAVLPCAYTLATGISYKIWDGMWYRLSCTSVLIGAAASGKSFCRPVVKAWLSPLKMADLAARKIEDDYKRQREANAQKGMRDKRPQQCIRMLPATASLSTLNERSQNARRPVKNVPQTQEYTQHVHLITVEYEFATVVKSLKQNFSSYLDFLIKSHQDEEVGVDYRNDASANGIRNIHWNQLFAGNMMDFKRLIPDNSVLNGMPLRLLIGFIPDNAYDMNVQNGTLTAHRRSEIIATAYLLNDMTGNVDVSPLSAHMFQWSKRRAELAKESGDKVADYIRRRCGSTIGMRAGVLSAVIRNAPKWDKLPIVVLNDEKGMLDSDKEYARQLRFTKDDLLLAELIADYAFEQQYKLFKRPLEKAFEDSMLPSNGLIYKQEREKTIERFNSLPETFTPRDVAEAFCIKYASAKTKCAAWKNDGKVRYDKRKKKYVKL